MDIPSEQSIEPANVSPLTHTQHMGKALFSATVFGIIGGAFGHWLGVRGNEPNRKLAAPIMKWGLGIFSAILALYSSFKASERVEQADQQHTSAAKPMGEATDAAAQVAPAVNVNLSTAHVPLSSISIQDAQHQGMVNPAVQHQVA